MRMVKTRRRPYIRDVDISVSVFGRLRSQASNKVEREKKEKWKI